MRTRTTLRAAALGLTLLVAQAALAQTADPPPYPYAVPDWYERYDRLLDEKRLGTDFRGLAVGDAVAQLGKKSGVRIRLCLTSETLKRAQRMHLNTSGIRLRDVLQLMSMMALPNARLETRIGRSGLVMTDDPDSFPTPEHGDLRRWMRRWRPRTEPASWYVGKRDKETLAKLQSRSLTLDFARTPLQDVVQFLRESTDTSMVVDPELLKDRSEEQLKTTIRCETLAADKVLEAVCKQLDIGFRITNDVVFITSLAGAKEQLDQGQAEGLRKARAWRKAWRSPVDCELRGLRMHEVGAALSKALGEPVRTGPRAWRMSGRIGLSTRGLTPAQLDQLLSWYGVRLSRGLLLLEDPSPATKDPDMLRRRRARLAEVEAARPDLLARALIGALDDRRWSVRDRAARALGPLGGLVTGELQRHTARGTGEVRSRLGILRRGLIAPDRRNLIAAANGGGVVSCTSRHSGKATLVIDGAINRRPWRTEGDEKTEQTLTFRVPGAGAWVGEVGINTDAASSRRGSGGLRFEILVSPTLAPIRFVSVGTFDSRSAGSYPSGHMQRFGIPPSFARLLRIRTIISAEGHGEPVQISELAAYSSRLMPSPGALRDARTLLRTLKGMKKK